MTVPSKTRPWHFSCPWNGQFASLHFFLGGVTPIPVFSLILSDLDFHLDAFFRPGTDGASFHRDVRQGIEHKTMIPFAYFLHPFFRLDPQHVFALIDDRAFYLGSADRGLHSDPFAAKQPLVPFVHLI